MRIVVKVTCDTGRTWITPINTDLKGAKAYFMGQTFVDECELTGKETPHTVTEVIEAEKA